MNCKNALGCMQPFIDEDIDIKSLTSFVEHIQTCDDCLDELEVRYLMQEGFARLEEGDVFDLKGEFDKKLERAKATVRLAQKLRSGFTIGVGVLIVAVVSALLIFGL